MRFSVGTVVNMGYNLVRFPAGGNANRHAVAGYYCHRADAIMIRLTIYALFLAFIPAAGMSAYEKGGVLDGGPRAAAIGGAGSSLSDDALTAGGCPAGLAWLGAPSLAAAIGMDGVKELSSAVMGAGGTFEGVGLGGQYRRTAFKSASEQLVSLGTGLPIEELGWLSVGVGIKYMAVDMKVDRASGFGLDMGVMGRHALPWNGTELRWAAAVEDAMGGLKWESGFEEDLSRQSRLGLGLKLATGTAILSEVRRINSILGDETIVSGGVEQVISSWGADFALRTGIRDGSARPASVSGGLGVKYGPVSADYAAVQGLGAGGGIEHLISFSWMLGAGIPVMAGGRGKPGEEASMIPVSNPLEFNSIYESAEFSVNTPRNSRPSSWVVAIMDHCGDVIWDLEGEGPPPASLKWNGTTLNGEPAVSGIYSCVLMLRGPSSLQQVSRTSSFKLKRPRDETSIQLPEGAGGF